MFLAQNQAETIREQQPQCRSIESVKIGHNTVNARRFASTLDFCDWRRNIELLLLNQRKITQLFFNLPDDVLRKEEVYCFASLRCASSSHL